MTRPLLWSLYRDGVLVIGPVPLKQALAAVLPGGRYTMRGRRG